MATQICLLIANIVLINVAFVLAFMLRYCGNVPESNFAPFKDCFIFLTFIYMLAFALTRCFKKRFRCFWDLFMRVFAGLFFGTLFAVVLLYVFRIQWSTFPSSIFVICFPIALFLIFTFDGLLLAFTNGILKKAIIIGKEKFSEPLKKRPFVESTHIERIEELLDHKDVDEIVIGKKIPANEQLNLLIYLLLKLKVSVMFSPAIYAELVSGHMMEENSAKFLTTFVGRKSECEEFLLRALDLLGSMFILILTSPLIAVVSILTKLTSEGPVFYKQVRVAKDGGTFTLYKFRTMINDAEKQTGPVLADQYDPRVTKIGRFLRETRIDELPQLINVIKGDMSLVGPRPERPYFVKLHEVLRKVRLAVKPGLTGFAQIRNFYDLQPRHKIKYDYLYIQKRSLLLNIYILFKTVPVVLGKKGW